MLVSPLITLDRSSEKYTVNIKRYAGGCKKEITYDGWLLTSKLKKRHEIEFLDEELDGLPKNYFFKYFTYDSYYAPRLSSEPIDFADCVPVSVSSTKVVNSKTDLIASMGSKANLEECKQLSESLNFRKYTYIGANVSTGYCKNPNIWSTNFTEYAGSRLLVLTVTFLKPTETCRALSRHTFWRKTEKRVVYRVLLKPFGLPSDLKVRIS